METKLLQWLPYVGGRKNSKSGVVGTLMSNYGLKII